MTTERKRGRPAVDITGRRFGRLVAIEPTSTRYDHAVVWRLLCDCGTEALAPVSRLNRGHVRSCGCMRRENMRRAQTFSVAARKGSQSRAKAA